MLGIGLASLFSDWSHEIATTLMPAFSATMGVAAGLAGPDRGCVGRVIEFRQNGQRLLHRPAAAAKAYRYRGLPDNGAGNGLFRFGEHRVAGPGRRAIAWLGRGVRTPVRKALLAGSVTGGYYGRAFGFERMMDTLGAVIGPATAFALLALIGNHYPTLFALTLIPGLLAVGMMAFVVKEKERKPVPHISFGESLRALPLRFRKFLVAVGLFGMGDFAHTMLILLAAQKLTPTWGAAKAASAATGLYVLHNILYAGFAFVAGWMADRFHKGRLLACGYFLAAVMAVCVMLLPFNVWTLALIFVLGSVSGDGGNARRFLLRRTRSARNTTGWPSARWQGSTASETSPPALFSDCFGRSLGRRRRLAIVRCYF